MERRWQRWTRVLFADVGATVSDVTWYDCLLDLCSRHYIYDDISLFVPFFDIPVSLGNLFQRIASIDDRFDLSRLNKFFDENQIFTDFRRDKAQMTFLPPIIEVQAFEKPVSS